MIKLFLYYVLHDELARETLDLCFYLANTIIGSGALGLFCYCTIMRPFYILAFRDHINLYLHDVISYVIYMTR